MEISPLYSIPIYSLYKNYLHLIHFFKIQAAKRHTNQIQNYKISYIYHLPFSKVTDVSYNLLITSFFVAVVNLFRVYIFNPSVDL